MRSVVTYAVLVVQWGALLHGSASAQARGAPAAVLVTPPVTFGGYDDRPAYTFSRIVAGSVISRSEVAVVDRVAREIRVFDREGTHLRTMGREGEGPGEFQFPRALQSLSGDRVVAWDFQAKRVSVFSSRGEHLRTTGVAVAPTAFLWADYVGSFSDESFVLRYDPNEMMLRDEPAGYRTDPTSFVHYSAEGDELGVLCVVTGPERFLYQDGSGWGLEDRILERSVVGLVADDVLHCGSTESLDLKRVSRDGESLAELAIAREPILASPDEVEIVRQRVADEILLDQERLARARSSTPFALPDDTQARLERLKAREAYRTRPAFRSLVASSDGVLWVEDYGGPASNLSRWARVEGFDVTGWLELPSGETVLGIDHGVVLTRSEDQFGVHSVHIRQLVDPDA